jgi:tetratricopeptide (TPR) repeat protein
MVSTVERLLADCRALAARSAWEEMHRMLHNRTADSQGSPGLITLYTESLLRTGDPRSARRWLGAHHDTLVRSGDRTSMRKAANLLGAASFELGDIDAASQAFERARDLARIDGDDLLVARATNNLAVIATLRGRHADALGLYASAIPAYQRLGRADGLAESHHNMAIVLRKLQRLDEADEQERRAADFARRVGNDLLVALTLVGRSEISLLRGDAPLAEAAALRAATDLGAVPDHAREADAIRLAGAARFAQGKLAGARDALDCAVALAERHGSALIEGESRWVRAQVSLALGDSHAAREDAERAAALFAQLEASAEHAAVLEWLMTHQGSFS